MGIGTLIIFIATILVAAVAAGVLISTSGMLQQKALTVGEQVRVGLVNGISIEQVFAAGDTVNKTANNFEILIRPAAGSNPIQMKTMIMSFFTETIATTAELEVPATDELSCTEDITVTTSWTALGCDLDDDLVNDYVQLVTGGTDNLSFNLSNTDTRINVSTGYRISAAMMTEMEDFLIEEEDGDVWGYVQSNQTSGAADQINITVKGHFVGRCSFSLVAPERKYCVSMTVGDGDTILEHGESALVYFKTKVALDESEEYEIKFFPAGGRSTFLQDRIPDVINKAKLFLWP